jgi:HEPN domain-containing protein
MPEFNDAQTADDWDALADDHGKAAQTLFRAKLFNQAYSQAGLAVECALKARIIRFERLNAWPSRASRPELYVHDLVKLIGYAGLAMELDSHIAAANEVGTNGMVVKDWVFARYRLLKTPIRDARDMVKAVCDPKHGLIGWIRKRP